MPYAVIDPDGEVRYVVDTVHQAVQAASQFSPIVHVEDGPPPNLGDAALGAVNITRPQHALRMSGLRPMAMPSMSLEEAHARLYPFFPVQRRVLGRKIKGRRVFYRIPKQVAVTAYDTPRKMSERLLGQNYKTAKEDLAFEMRADVQGLSLLPSTSYAEAAQTRGAKNACVGASAACIASCLVYSGHNTIDPYNVMVKAARTQALAREPQAFIRMLAENIARHARTRDAQPYVRLNVFSDLPWELICPDLFDEFSDLVFYDYTKVENRGTPPNYDLTFSFSGDNHAQVAHELRRGRRIAVVFIPPYRVSAAERRRGEGLPPALNAKLFGERGMLQVIDGDVSDVRPRDPGQAVIGLRWKIPMGRQAEAFAEAQEAAFAIPVHVVDDVLVAATSARQEPIYDADDDFEEA